MQEYSNNILQTLFLKNRVGKFLPWAAVLFTIAVFVINLSDVIDKLQNNVFSFAGDTIIIVVAFVGTTLIAWAELLLGHLLAELMGLLLFATAMAMVHGPWVLFSVVVLFIGYGTARTPFLQKSFYPKALLSSLAWFTRQERDFPVAKFASLSKIPYQLFPVSCILLN